MPLGDPISTRSRTSDGVGSMLQPMPSKIVVPWKIIDRLLLPIIFFLTSLVAVLTFWQLLLGHRRAEIHAVTDEQASFVNPKWNRNWVSE